MAGSSEPLHRQVNHIVANALRAQATQSESPEDRYTAALEALAMDARSPSGPDSGPARRNKQEYIALPTDNETLRIRGSAFLEAFGLHVPDQHLSVVNRDELLEITITDPIDPVLFAQTTITVTRKGEALARSIGEFLSELGATPFIEMPSRLQELAANGQNLEALIVKSLDDSTDAPYGIRDHYDLDVSDEAVGQTLSGTIHLLQAVAEKFTSKTAVFAQPLVIIETTMRNRWPYQGSIKETLILTDPIPAVYENVADKMADLTQREIRTLEKRLTMLSRRIRTWLNHRDIDSTVCLPIDEVYINKHNGRLLVTSLGYAIEDADETVIDDDNDGDEGGDIVLTPQ